PDPELAWCSRPTSAPFRSHPGRRTEGVSTSGDTGRSGGGERLRGAGSPVTRGVCATEEQFAQSVATAAQGILARLRWSTSHRPLLSGLARSPWIALDAVGCGAGSGEVIDRRRPPP